MSIKSDKWIKKMAKQENMISPFEPDQIKSLSGNKVISYGILAMAMMLDAQVCSRYLQISIQP